MERTESQERHAVGPLTQRLATLWARVRAQSTPPGLDQTLSELHATYRELVNHDATLPETAPAQRHRRNVLEALQSAVVEHEAELARSSEAAARLKALAQRQLTTAREALRAWPALPPSRNVECFRGQVAAWAILGFLLSALGLLVRCIVDPCCIARVSLSCLAVTAAVMSAIWAVQLRQWSVAARSSPALEFQAEVKRSDARAAYDSVFEPQRGALAAVGLAALWLGAFLCAVSHGFFERFRGLAEVRSFEVRGRD